MKIVIFHPPLYPVNHDFFNELGKKAELIVYCIGEYPVLHENWHVAKFSENAINYKIKSFGKNTVNFFDKFNPKLFFELIKDQPDIVLSVAFWFPSLFCSLFKRFFGFKFLIITDAIYETDKHVTGVKLFLRKLVCSNSHGVICGSKLTESYIQYLSKYTQIYSSIQTIDVSKWKVTLDMLSDNTCLRKELGLPTDKVILLSVGGFLKIKNWGVVFKQMNILDNYHYVLIGDGELKKEYQGYVNENELSDKVSIIARQEGENLIKYFKSSDIFVFPSLGDTFGFVVSEAMAASLPVIVTFSCGASSLVKDGVNGYVVEANGFFVEELELIRKNLPIMSQNANATIKKYTLKNKADEYVRIIKRVQMKR
ncbi:MAG: glycosyltransferase [Alteromonadaceae bacterium]|nr:glycosyltransferase [Alteromonadaceae bacterium]